MTQGGHGGSQAISKSESGGTERSKDSSFQDYVHQC